MWKTDHNRIQTLKVRVVRRVEVVSDVCVCVKNHAEKKHLLKACCCILREPEDIHGKDVCVCVRAESDQQQHFTHRGLALGEMLQHTADQSSVKAQQGVYGVCWVLCVLTRESSVLNGFRHSLAVCLYVYSIGGKRTERQRDEANRAVEERDRVKERTV